MSAGREDRFDVSSFGVGSCGVGSFGVGSFDVVVADAWQRFESNLATHVSSMPEGTYVTVTSAQASPGQRGQRPYVDLVATGADLLVGVASLPSYLYPDDLDVEAADRRLHGLGWSEAGKPTIDGTVMDFTFDGARDEAGLLATMAVATFREVWNVPHPSFLSAWTVGLADGGTGPVTFSREPAAPATGDVIPTSLRSLHTFCEVVGGPLDTATVMSVCGNDDLAELEGSALKQSQRCTSRATEFARGGLHAQSRVWNQKARSWTDTADSLRAALDGVASGQDRPAKSAGS